MKSLQVDRRGTGLHVEGKPDIDDSRMARFTSGDHTSLLKTNIIEISMNPRPMPAVQEDCVVRNIWTGPRRVPRLAHSWKVYRENRLHSALRNLPLAEF